MPSRAAALAKVVICSRQELSSRAPVATQPQSRQLHIPTQITLKRSKKSAPPTANSAVSVFLSPLLHRVFHISHRHHHHHHSTKMDAALAKLFVSNAQWVKAVNTAEPGFFEGSAKGQTPKVRLRLHFFSHHVQPMTAPWGRHCPSFCVALYAQWFVCVYGCTPTDSLARMLGLSRPRERRDRLAPRRPLRSPQHREPDPPERRQRALRAHICRRGSRRRTQYATPHIPTLTLS